MKQRNNGHEEPGGAQARSGPGFHVNRESWAKYRFEELLGRDERPGVRQFRELADRVNNVRAETGEGETASVSAGGLMALDRIVEAMRCVWIAYCDEQNPGVVERAVTSLESTLGESVVDEALSAYLTQFGGQQDRAINTRELSLMLLESMNPAVRQFGDLIGDGTRKLKADYPGLVRELEAYLDQQPSFEPTGETLFRVLRAPLDASPDSLEGQLAHIRREWSSFLPPELLGGLVLAADVVNEEQTARVGGPGPPQVLEFESSAVLEEGEKFSPDADWMSNVVLMAKSTYVWLDQLSKQYGRHIYRLDQVPDEELDKLARWGFTGLWLIGLWRRSPASRTIKQRMGNPEAEASAYSLDDYVINEDLGGEEAFNNLRERAGQRGIRMAGDMVPNHMGIDSNWVVERPELFVQTPEPPYPGYGFSSENICEDPRVRLHLEDGYWDHSDAAVVFRRVDAATGETSYIYHGNDGTSMPWNDTAQLDFLKSDVREAVIQAVLHVARRFSIIRFDAAMTLAKKHFQRLWYPAPGDAGAVPSRVEHGMSKQEFNAHFPVEFWREVVDRVAEEAPDTLLLAEAFWLMEGYFVRTLGMHRVYNSAFMNMLKMEENGKFRETLSNVLEFSPEVLKRFVNFMNNPDERTAVEQFGKGDKYVGVAILLVTLPGLPMFGHGQVEGYTEKYGMEYRRAYYDEQPDEELVRRHEAEIFPLMQRRQLFSGAGNFVLYNFETANGYDENVFAYSNRIGDERALVLYHNAYRETEGVVKGITEALGLTADPGRVIRFREHRTGRELTLQADKLAEEGLSVKLHAYEYQVFLDFREEPAQPEPAQPELAETTSHNLKEKMSKACSTAKSKNVAREETTVDAAQLEEKEGDEE